LYHDTALLAHLLPFGESTVGVRHILSPISIDLFYLPHGRFHRRQYRLGNALHGSWWCIVAHAEK